MKLKLKLPIAGLKKERQVIKHDLAYAKKSATRQIAKLEKDLENINKEINEVKKNK